MMSGLNGSSNMKLQHRTLTETLQEYPDSENIVDGAIFLIQAENAVNCCIRNGNIRRPSYSPVIARALQL